jgi:hypothetical protein
VKGEQFYPIETAKFQKQDGGEKRLNRSEAPIQGRNYGVFGSVDIVNCVMAGRVKWRGGSNLLQRSLLGKAF